jgi:hypothetical protein
VFLAGQKRHAIAEEWQCHLLGEFGRGLASRDQIRAARGFLLAAMRYRLSDATEAAWVPVDAMLKSRTLSNALVLSLTAAAAMVILRHEGGVGVVMSAESVGTIGGALYGLIRTGRWWRNVKPPEPKARRVRE